MKTRLLIICLIFGLGGLYEGVSAQDISASPNETDLEFNGYSNSNVGLYNPFGNTFNRKEGSGHKSPKRNLNLKSSSGSRVLLNQNTSTVLEDNNYIACANWGAQKVEDNYFSRVFDLSTYGFTDSLLNLDSIIFGIGDLQGVYHPIEVSFYELNGAYQLSNMTLLETVIDTIHPSMSYQLIKVPISATINTSSTLVVEIFTPEEFSGLRLFYFGHNNDGQTAPSYIRAATCGAIEPSTLASFGYADVHYIIQATGILGNAQSNIEVSKLSTTSTSCLGSLDGALAVQATGGAEPYQFSLDGNNYKFGSAFTGLAAGDYVVYAKDANGVVAVSDTITVTSPTALSAYIVTIHHVTCYNGADGGATINIQGGTPPYTYQLGGITTVGYSIQQSKAGTFSPTVTDARGCVLVMDPLTINQPAAYSLSVTATDFPTCGDGLSGAISATAAGGTPPYTYYLNGEMVGVSGEISGLGIGTHVVSVVDAESCEIVANPVSFSGPSLIGVGSVAVTNAICNGGTGSIAVTASGDVSGVQYSIDGGAYQSSNVFEGLSAGTYEVAVKNSFACEASATVTITEPMAMQLSAQISQYKSCTGNNPAVITLKALGGQPPFAYRMGAGGFQSSNVFGDLIAGSYSFTVIDAKGCSASVSNVTIDAYQPLVLSAFTDGQNVCVGNANGRVVGVANGGQAPYSYFLSGIGTQSTGVFENLASGAYVLTITDALDCLVQSDTLVIAAPSPITGGLVVLNQLECGDDQDGIIQAWASGGAIPYTYSLNGMDYSSESVFTNLGSGSYRAYVKDANGCVFVSEEVNLISPAFMTIAAHANSVSCNGYNDGSIVVSVTGGNPPYQYATSSQGPWVSDNTITGLGLGAQHLFVRGANGCVQFYGVVDIPEPEVLELTATSTPEMVYKDGTIQMNVTGGRPPYTYAYYAFGVWNKSLNSKVNWLAAGTYLVAAADNFGCADTTTVTVSSEIGLEEEEGLIVQLYPVPSNSIVNIEMSEIPSKLEILNNIGVLVYSQTQFGSEKMQLDLGHLAKGMYQVRLATESNNKVIPLLLQ